MSRLLPTLRAFGEETRLRILRLVSARELAVGELVEALGAPQARVSRHLAVLRRAELVTARREGNCLYYRMAGEGLSPFAAAVWRAVRAAQSDDGFFPGDLQRLRDALARRESRSSAYFDDVVAQWDRVRRSYIDDALTPEAAAGLVGPEMVVADVGTGTGQLLEALARAARAVIAVDRSEKMLALCAAKARRLGLANVHLRRGRAEALPVASGSCDAAFSSMVLHHVADPAAAVCELARIVRPGGRVVVSDLVEHDEDWTREVMADLWLGFSEAHVRRWFAAAALGDVAYSCGRPGGARRGERPRKLRAFVATAVKGQQA